MTTILGLCIHTGQTGACALVDGEVVAACAEERFSRIKRDTAFPSQAIDFCMKEAGVDNLSTVDGIALAWNPAVPMRNINLSGFTKHRRYDPEYLYIAPNNMMSRFDPQSAADHISMQLDTKGGTFYYVDHHKTHIANCLADSPFDKGAFAIIDEYGEHDSVTVGRFNGNDVTVLATTPFPHSLGVFFAAITQFLGFHPGSEEWKVMGAAAYGNPDKFIGPVSRLLEWDADEGQWFLNQKYIDFANMKRAGYLSRHFSKFIGLPARQNGAPLEQAHYDVAAAAQMVFEQLTFKQLEWLHKTTGEENLCVAGGCFMNSLCNGKILANTPFKELFIPYAAADNGSAIGAAQWVYHQVLGNPFTPRPTTPSPLLGPSYSKEYVRELLEKYKLNFSECSDVAAEAARDLADGKLVGWFSDRLEFGERALGSRSILADPRSATMKDTINASVKYREAFRPFAASVLREVVHEYFDVPEGAIIPYMERVVQVRDNMRSKIAAVVHHDGSCRIQTVNSAVQPGYADLIREFKKLTGVGLVLNTSFNVQGEPIVCSPSDALKTFHTSGLEVLYLEGFRVAKAS